MISQNIYGFIFFVIYFIVIMRKIFIIWVDLVYCATSSSINTSLYRRIFPTKAKFFLWKFSWCSLYNAKYFLWIINPFIFGNIEKNILMQKKDTWAIVTFNEDCNLVFSRRFSPDTPYHYLNIAASVQRNLLILQENKSMTK